MQWRVSVILTPVSNHRKSGKKDRCAKIATPCRPILTLSFKVVERKKERKGNERREKYIDRPEACL